VYTPRPPRTTGAWGWGQEEQEIGAGEWGLAQAPSLRRHPFAVDVLRVPSLSQDGGQWRREARKEFGIIEGLLGITNLGTLSGIPVPMAPAGWHSEVSYKACSVSAGSLNV